MPATPRFKVSQTHDAVVVCIKVPHVRVGSAETHVDGTEFSFYCKPYLLRLTLPHEVGGEDDDGSCKAVYDPADDNGTITVTLAKAIPGLHFPDLDLTTTLMQPRWTPKDLLKERPSNSDPGGGRSGGAEGAATFSSGVEVISSEHYDVRDDDSDGAGDAEEAAAGSAAGPGPEGGATGGGSTRTLGGGGREDDKRVGGASAAAGAGEADGGLGAEVLIRPPSYGFNDKYSGFFASLREELREMIHLPDPDNTLPSARRGLRLEHEQAAFDADRYLGDLFTEDEDPLLTEALAFEAHWQRRLGRDQRRRRRQHQHQQRVKAERVSSAGSGGGEAGNCAAVGNGQEAGVGEKGEALLSAEEEGEGGEEEEDFTEKEQEQMRRLPNREYLIEVGSQEERRVLLGLADILFAYAYDHRTTTADASVESAWTVAVLSPLLSWLEVPDEGGRGNEPSPAAVDGSVEADLALAGIRRSLIFPYLRVWELGALVARDVRDILAGGRRCVLRCLLQTYAIMERGEVHYLLNKLFIEDYCVWIQKASEESIAALAQRYAASLASVTKAGAGLDLERLEAEAVRLIAEGGGDGENSGESSEEEESSSDEDSSEEDETSGEEDSSSEEEEEEGGSSRGEEGSNGGSSSGRRDDGDGDGDGDKKGGGVAAAATEDEGTAVSVGETRRTLSTEVARKEDTVAAAAGTTAATATAATAAAGSAEVVEIREAERAPPSLDAGNSKSTGDDDGSRGVTKEAPTNVTAVTSTPTVQEATNDIATPTTAAAGRAQTSKDLLHLESLVSKASLEAGDTADGGESSSTLTSRLAVLGLGGQRGPTVPEDGAGGDGAMGVGRDCGADELPLSSEAAGCRAGRDRGGIDGGGAAEVPSGPRQKKLIEEL